MLCFLVCAAVLCASGFPTMVSIKTGSSVGVNAQATIQPLAGNTLIIAVNAPLTVSVSDGGQNVYTGSGVQNLGSGPYISVFRVMSVNVPVVCGTLTLTMSTSGTTPTTWKWYILEYSPGMNGWVNSAFGWNVGSPSQTATASNDLFIVFAFDALVVSGGFVMRSTFGGAWVGDLQTSAAGAYSAIMSPTGTYSYIQVQMGMPATTGPTVAALPCSVTSQTTLIGDFSVLAGSSLSVDSPLTIVGSLDVGGSVQVSTGNFINVSGTFIGGSTSSYTPIVTVNRL